MKLEEALTKSVKMLIKESDKLKSFNEGTLRLSLKSTHPLWDSDNLTEVLEVGIDVVSSTEDNFELETRGIHKKLYDGDALIASQTSIIE